MIDLLKSPIRQFCLFVIFLFAFSIQLHADELIYTPVNPAFGGNSLNGNWLLANAQAQNDYEDPDLEDAQAKSPIELFRDTLERLLLRDIATDIADYVTGDTETLTFDEWIDVGDFMIRLEDSGGDTVIITLMDADGDTTEITVDSDW